MYELPSIHRGSLGKSHKKLSTAGQTGGIAGCENSQPTKFRNLRNYAGCENSQPCKIYVVFQFSSACGSNFLPTSVMSYEFGLNSSCLDWLDNFGLIILQKLQKQPQNVIISIVVTLMCQLG